jgi:hypothetical protein
MLEAQFNQREGAARPNLLEFASDGDPAFRWVWRFFHRVYNDMQENLDSVYATYAVSTITHQMGWLALIAKYARDSGTTLMDASTETAAAANQGIDKNWKQPDLPLITSKFAKETGGMLPHQARVRNMLKDSPAFAVLSVHAGGGKSMLAITDVLTEIKAHRSAPYLIMCPSHLIANYVSELVEFTDGMVNVIPITSANIRTTGYKRYEAILNSAPINTVILVDYDALKFRAKATVYGTTSVAVYPVVEMLRKFKPGYALLDECHLLKNTRSSRFKTLMSLIADIPKKRIASGTLNPDSPSDLAGQLAIMDPTIFGSRERFNDMFAAETKGSKVIKWKPQAGAVALEMLKGTMVWAEAKRREWACALPPRTDRFISVELTDRQREVYDALFNDMVQSIRREAEGKGGKKAKKLLESLEGKKASKADDEDFENLGEEGGEGGSEDILDDTNDVGAGLQPYLAYLEMFVSDPAGHPYAVNGWVAEDGTRHPPLSGDDLKSPKALMLAKQLETWVSTKKSKAIVFTNYTNTAEALYNAMPPELQASGLLYKASEKVELISKFTTDPNIKWLIGIRKSMEVGLNLQAAGYLVRMEGVWNPGEQEQGDSRICRPYFGPGGDQRDEIVFDTIVADKTIDITKAARLRAKIVALAKFENPNDQAYQEIEDLPLLKMTLDVIQGKNDFNENLAEYASSMNHLNQVMKADYAAYAEQIKAEGGFKFTQIDRSETPAECRLLARVPYAHGTQLYAAADLGLVRVDNYLGQEMSAEEEEEGDTEGDEELEELDEEAAANQALLAQKEILIGKRCHTEIGEGYIANVGFKKGKLTRVLVNLDDGTTYRQHVTNVFVATREETNSIDMRNAIAKSAGLEITAPITVPALTVKQTRITQKMLREQEQAQKEKLRLERLAEKAAKRNKKQVSVALHLSIINGYLRLGYTPTDAAATKAMEAVGFKVDQPYVYTLIRSARHLLTQARLWADAGFNTAKDVDNDALSLLHEELSSGALRSHKHYVTTVANGGFQNYIRKTWKPNPDKKLLTMFALITDGGNQERVLVNRAEKEGQDTPYGAAYLCMPLGGGFPATPNAIKPQYKAPGTTWRRAEDELSIFVSGFSAVRKVLVDLKEAGIMVTNVDEMNRQARSVKRAQGIIKTEGLDLHTDEDWTDSPEKAKKASKNGKVNKAEEAEKQRKSKKTGR